MNLTVLAREVWRLNAHVDPLTSFFNRFYKDNGLVDIQPTNLGLMWNNKRMGRDGLAKQVDCFNILEELLESLYKYRSWMVKQGILDHFPIILQLEQNSKIIRCPFKFNLVWLEDVDFKNLIKDE